MPGPSPDGILPPTRWRSARNPQPNPGNAKPGARPGFGDRQLCTVRDRMDRRVQCVKRVGLQRRAAGTTGASIEVAQYRVDGVTAIAEQCGDVGPHARRDAAVARHPLTHAPVTDAQVASKCRLPPIAV